MWGSTSLTLPLLTLVLPRQRNKAQADCTSPCHLWSPLPAPCDVIYLYVWLKPLLVLWGFQVAARTSLAPPSVTALTCNRKPEAGRVSECGKRRRTGQPSVSQGGSTCLAVWERQSSRCGVSCLYDTLTGSYCALGEITASNDLWLLAKCGLCLGKTAAYLLRKRNAADPCTSMYGAQLPITSWGGHRSYSDFSLEFQYSQFLFIKGGYSNNIVEYYCMYI